MNATDGSAKTIYSNGKPYALYSSSHSPCSSSHSDPRNKTRRPQTGSQNVRARCRRQDSPLRLASTPHPQGKSLSPSLLSRLTFFFRKHSTISSMTSSTVRVSLRPILLSATAHAPFATTLQCNTNPVKSPSSVTIVVHDFTSSLSTLNETNPVFQSPSRNSNS